MVLYYDPSNPPSEEDIQTEIMRGMIESLPEAIASESARVARDVSNAVSRGLLNDPEIRQRFKAAILQGIRDAPEEAYKAFLGEYTKASDYDY